MVALFSREDQLEPRSPLLDYQSAPMNPHSENWSYLALNLGLFGLPASVLLFAYLDSLWPVALLSFASLCYIYLAQARFRPAAALPMRLSARIGVVLVLLWAPVLLVWSFIFIISPIVPRQ